MQQCVLLATPSTYGDLRVEYCLALAETQIMLMRNGISHKLLFLHDIPYVSKARNILCSMAMRDPEITDLFFLDYDISWPSAKVLEFLQRPEDVIAGVYPSRRDKEAWPVWLEKEADGTHITKNGLYLATFAPTGFMRIKRNVLEKLAETTTKYKDVYNSSTDELWGFFEACIVNQEIEALRKVDLNTLTREQALHYLQHFLGHVAESGKAEFWGEDYWFSKRWQDVGGKIWIDPDVMFTHVGRKQFSGSLTEGMCT